MTRLVLSVFLVWTAAALQLDIREAARLDGEGRCAESESYYRAALAAGEPSPALLNNAGNHYLLCQRPGQARLYFERLVKISPAHANANLQLARLAVMEREGDKALEYLARVNSVDGPVRLLRAEALHWAGKREASLAAMNSLVKEAGSDPRALFALGIAFARLERYDRAEEVFQRVLIQEPGDFDALFHLGRAAARAGHYPRARGALEAASKIRPADADVLLELGLVCAASKDYSRAVYLLAQARQHRAGLTSFWPWRARQRMRATMAIPR